jgi:hypothetical protein
MITRIVDYWAIVIVVGFVFYMDDTVFIWISKKQSIVTLSTCKAKYICCYSLKCLLWDLDNKLALALVTNPIIHDKSKYIDLMYHFIQERMLKMKFNLNY